MDTDVQAFINIYGTEEIQRDVEITWRSAKTFASLFCAAASVLMRLSSACSTWSPSLPPVATAGG